MVRILLLSTFTLLNFGNVEANAEEKPVRQSATTMAKAKMFTVEGEGLTPAQKEQFAEYYLAGYTAKLERLDGPALAGIITGSLYSVVIHQKRVDDIEIDQRIVSYDGKAFHSMPDAFPNTWKNRKMPGLLKLIDKNFKLKNEADAKRFQTALDKLYPLDDGFPNEVAKEIRHSGNQWTFVRERFQDNRFQGFILTTNADGTITSVEYSLGLKK